MPQVFEFPYKSEQLPSVVISVPMQEQACDNQGYLRKKYIGESCKVLNIFHLYICMTLILLS